MTSISNLDFDGAPFSKTNHPNIWRKDVIDLGKMAIFILAEESIKYDGLTPEKVLFYTKDKSVFIYIHLYSFIYPYIYIYIHIHSYTYT